MQVKLFVVTPKSVPERPFVATGERVERYLRVSHPWPTSRSAPFPSYARDLQNKIDLTTGPR